MPEISREQVQKLTPLPSYLPNMKSYLVNNCPIYFKMTKSEIRSVDIGSNIAQNHLYSL